MRSLLKYTLFSIQLLSEDLINTLTLPHSVNIMLLDIIDNDHGVVKIQFYNHQDLEQRKI